MWEMRCVISICRIQSKGIIQAGNTLAAFAALLRTWCVISKLRIQREGAVQAGEQGMLSLLLLPYLELWESKCVISNLRIQKKEVVQAGT